MKVALIGCDRESLEIAAWIQRHPAHSLVTVLEADWYATELAARNIDVRGLETDSWEALLSLDVADVVVVCGRSSDAVEQERRDDQLRKLVQAAVPIIAVHPACEMIMALELDMIRQDTGCRLLPYHPAILHPAFEKLTVVAGDPGGSVIGPLQQIVFERFDESRDRDTVLDHFSRDAQLIRQLMVDVTGVSAMGGPAGDAQFANLGVHLSGTANVLARWSIGPVRDLDGGRLTLVGANGQAVLSMSKATSNYDLTIGDQCADRSKWLNWNPVELIFDKLQSELQDNRGAQSDWDEACRALELTDAVADSCRRGRTIQIHSEKVTEEDTFKSMMAAGGCGLMLWVMLLLLVAGIVEGLQLPIRDTRFWNLWTLLLFLPLLLFLLLQLLKLVFSKKNPPTTTQLDDGSVGEGRA